MAVFVFGSNEAGIHGAGAAKDALNNYGAVFGKSYGHYGNSFAIPTKDEYFKTLPLETIKAYVEGFLMYARSKRKVKFDVTRIGCGLAGLKDEDVAILFSNAPLNCRFDEAWAPYLGSRFTYWGKFE